MKHSQSQQRPKNAFTLIELLVVVAIISILASIAVPNFLEAQTRSKVAATKADMRTLATAIESYRIDENRYPYRQGSPGYTGQSTQRPLGNGLSALEDMSILTTPVSFLSSLPKDLFRPKDMDEGQIVGQSSLQGEWDASDNIIDYWSSPIIYTHIKKIGEITVNNSIDITPVLDIVEGEAPWTLVSVGPDTIFGQVSKLITYPRPSENTGVRNSYRYDYDSTNGTISYGNIYRFRGQEKAIDIFKQ